jgi:zinc protease
MTPENGRADWAGLAAAPTHSAGALAGTVHWSLVDPAVRLVVSPQGVSFVDREEAATVKFDACAAMLIWPDGARSLVGDDAIIVRIEPTLFKDGHAPGPYLDATVPADRRIVMPPRDPEQIPKPRGAAATAATGSRTGAIVALVFLYPLAVLFGGLTALIAVVMADPDDALAGLIIMLMVSAALTGASVYGIVRNHRKLRALTAAGSGRPR